MRVSHCDGKVNYMSYFITLLFNKIKCFSHQYLTLSDNNDTTINKFGLASLLLQVWFSFKRRHQRISSKK